MCELMGMSSSLPTDVCFSFSGLLKRAGETGPHRDGWGIAYYEGQDVQLIKEPHPGTQSKLAAFLKEHPLHSELVISHIRKANRGKVCLANTHPFCRELWGRQWVFVHNGQLKGVKKKVLTYYHPVGTTDSEHAFCWMLSQIREKFSTPPSQSALNRYIRTLSEALHEHGVFNCLLSDSVHLYSYCATKMCSLIYQAPFGHATLVDAEMTVDLDKLLPKEAAITVIATRPLTRSDHWERYQRGQFCVYKKGMLVFESLR